MTVRTARVTAATVAFVAVSSCVSLILFFIVGGPLGTINDLGNGLLAVLCAVLALGLHRRRWIAATLIAVAGSAVSVFGSFLVISGSTGYFLAGLVSAFGFGLIGVWLLLRSRSADLPARRLAFVAAGVMALGTINVAGIVQGLDDQDAAPSWLLAAGICWAGTYVLLPIWAIRVALDGAVRGRSAGGVRT